jgi:hypothetical protein
LPGLQVVGDQDVASSPAAAELAATEPARFPVEAHPTGTSPARWRPTPRPPGWRLRPDPRQLEAGKVLGATIYGAKVIAIHGNYDQVNRLCSQIAFRFGWGFVNVNLRPFYAEGSKTMGFEIAEDLGWRAPDHVVAPMAGGSLVGKLYKAFKEFEGWG